MSAQAASIGSLLSALLLSDHRVLRLTWDMPFTHPLEWSELLEPTYLAYQPWAARFPDHVFDAAWRFLADRQQPGQEVLLTALQALIDEFLELRHGEVRVRRDLLGSWQQGLVSRVSSIPILAAADVSFGAGRYTPTPASRLQLASSDRQAAQWRRQILPLLRTEEAPVADYVEREGLHESHLHLNGSTHAEICWLRAIRNPRAEIREFITAWTQGQHAGRLRDLIGQANPELTPLIFYQHLRTATRLRSWLIGAAENRLAPNALLPVSCQNLCSAGNDEWSIGLREPPPSWQHEPDIEEELTWMAGLIDKLRKSNYSAPYRA